MVKLEREPDPTQGCLHLLLAALARSLLWPSTPTLLPWGCVCGPAPAAAAAWGPCAHCSPVGSSQGWRGRGLGGGFWPWHFAGGAAALQRPNLPPAAQPGAVPAGSARAPGARPGAAGAAAGRDGAEGDAETESCVALSGADVYCTGWAGWQGGRWERGPVPPALWLQGGTWPLARGALHTFSGEGSGVPGCAHVHPHLLHP